MRFHMSRVAVGMVLGCCGVAAGQTAMIEVLAGGVFTEVNTSDPIVGPFGDIQVGQRWSARYVFPAETSRTFGNANSSVWLNAIEPITFSFGGGEPIEIQPVTHPFGSATNLAGTHHDQADRVQLQFWQANAAGGTASIMLRADAPGLSRFGPTSEITTSDFIGLGLEDFASIELFSDLGIWGTRFRADVDEFEIRLDPNSVVPAPGAVAALMLGAGLALRRRRS